MKLFGKSGVAALAFGSAMMALVGQESVSAEQAEAANSELEAAGIKGAQLITEAAFTELSDKAARVDAAEKDATDAKAESEKTAKDLTAANNELATLRKQPGADHTSPTLEAGKSDVEPGEPDAHQKAIDDLPHNKALAGHPLFG